jgi:peptide/nickel transport system substrate-binding protein
MHQNSKIQEKTMMGNQIFSFRGVWRILAILCLLLLIACGDSGEETAVIPVPPTPTNDVVVTSVVAPSETDFIVVATDAPNPPFTDFDQFGNVTGFVERIMAEIAATVELDYEFVVTPHEGVLESIAAGSNRDFDAVMSNLVIPEEAEEGIAYTQPYLEVGQVMVVLVDENRIQDVSDLQTGMFVGVPRNSSSEKTARELLGLTSDSLVSHYSSSVSALQALIDEQLTAVIIENYTAQYYVETYPDRLKIIGGDGKGGWLDGRAYGIAVAADNQPLLDQLNSAIEIIQNKGALDRITVELIPPEILDPGESRAGTPANELHIGIQGQIVDMDPAGSSDFISWEVKTNTMSGLFSFNSNSELVPMLATSFPEISETGLEYTIRLRQGIQFSDGSELTANDVKWSIDRARSLGNFLVNDFLKDTDENNFADDDAVQVIDQYTVKFVLQEPTSYFLSLLATPPYFPVSDECYAVTLDLESRCGGIGPYAITDWEIGEQMVLQANPEWPGQPGPAFENIILRFYNDTETFQTSLEKFQSIDIAWTGFPNNRLQALRDVDSEGDGIADYRVWDGPSIFKSYLMFNHDTEPWDRRKIREAAALSIDRTALAALFNNERSPLFSPVPDTIPGHASVLPQRDLERARALLLEEGYSESVPLPIEIWFVNDGRYSAIEEQYVNTIKSQLEETGVFQVTVSGANFETFRGQIGVCNYPAYLIGWPTPGRPTNYLDITSWTDFFVENTSTGFCSNYDNEEMLKLVEAANTETDQLARLATYAEIQTRWANDLPTLDLLQQKRFAIALPNVDNVRMDALGLLHYETLTKGSR